MSYRRTFVLPIIFIMVFLLYLSDAAVAMAVSTPEAGVQSEQEAPDSVSDNHAVPMPGTDTPPPGTDIPSVSGTDTPPPPETDTPPILETDASSVPDSGTSSSVTEADAIPRTAPVTEPQPDYVSTGEELMAWMEMHKNIGGSVRLSNHVTMDKAYVFVPTHSQPMEHLIVDTAGYTITVTDEVELWSAGQLTFIGKAGEYGILHVSAGGMLCMQGVNVEDGQTEEEQQSETTSRYILWQEEGAGLALGNCCMSGEVHYAQTPFVMYENSVHTIVEEGQTVVDVLPSQIDCDVIEQGRISVRQMPVSWNLEGTQKQQEERLRFTVQGSYIGAASANKLVCTIIYNDYPLTFTDVSASAGNGVYSFKGSYTRPDEYIPMTIATEYSFDGDNWFVDEERTVSDVNEPANFFIGVQDKTRSAGTHAHVYIRLRGEHNGICYLSNVLRYDTDDLAKTEEIGGGRGGGISVVNPPDAPEKQPVSVTSKPSVINTEGNTSANAGDDSVQTSSDVKEAMTDSSIHAQADAKASAADSSVQAPSDGETSAADPSVQAPSDGKTSAAGSFDAVAPELPEAGQTVTEPADIQPEKNADDSPESTEPSSHVIRMSFGNVTLVFVAISFCAGAAVFGIHAGIFRRAFSAFRRVLFK